MKISVLTGEQIERIHAAALETLRTVGVRIPHPQMRLLFREAGAEVDDLAQLVRIPRGIVNQSLEQAGKSFTLYGRDRDKRARFGVGERNYNTIAGEALWVDDSCTRRRYACLDDVVEATRLADGLDSITLVGAMSDPAEIPAAYRCVEVAAAQVRHTTKPFHFWFHDRASARFVLEVLTTVVGDLRELSRYPITYPFLEPISPLKFPFDGIDVLFETARASLPVPIGPMVQVGASGPGTLAGTLALEHAEILAGICITQLIKPGLPVVYGGIPHAFDMRSTQMIFAGPEQALMAVAMTQMGKHFDLPVYVNVGLTDSKVPDAQAGMEAGITLACGAMAGADIFGHLGICGVDQAASLTMLVMQHEVIGYVERLMGGIEVTDETLGLDVVREVGHDRGYLAHEHTVAHFRKELWFPHLLDRQFWEKWVEEGALTLHDRAREAKDLILGTHEPEPLDDDTTGELARVVEAARRELR